MEPKIIKPTIGRRVWYWPSEHDLSQEYMEQFDQSQAFDAGVVFVHSDREVNLVVSDHNATSYDRLHIPLIQPGDEKPVEGGYCEWMPYQIATAK